MRQKKSIKGDAANIVEAAKKEQLHALTNQESVEKLLMASQAGMKTLADLSSLSGMTRTILGKYKKCSDIPTGEPGSSAACFLLFRYINSYRAELKNIILKNVIDHAKIDHEFGLKFLEKTMPEEFGKQIVEKNIDHTITNKIELLSDSELSNMLDSKLKLLGLDLVPQLLKW